MATVWVGRLSRGAFYDYALAVGPIAAGLVLLPTLSAAAGREPPPRWPQLPLSLSSLYAYFTYGTDSWAAGRWWTCLTCGLCHGDALARDSSLLGLLIAGWGPASSLGVLLTVTTFFGGTAAAALNSSGRDLQTRKWLDNNTGGWASWATPRAARLYNAAGLWRMCGGSSGVFALVGVNLCLMLEQMCSVFRQWEAEPEDRPHVLGSLVWLLSGISHTVSMVMTEQRALSNSASGTQVCGLEGGLCDARL